AELRARAAPVSGRADLERIATTSANGEATLGKAIADAYQAVGADGALTVEAGKTLETIWERLPGLQWEGGYVSPYFMTDAATTECVYEDPLILLTDATLESHAPLLKPLEAAVTQRRPLLVVAEAVRGEALQTLVANKLRNNLRVVAGKAPLFGDRRRAMLEDTATVTGGRLVSERRGDDLAKIDPTALGGARRIVLTKDKTTIVGGAGTEADIAARAAGIRAEQALEDNTPFQQKLLRERLARLAGGIVIVQVGGGSETEIGERTDRADDAAQAVRAAAADGILPGGGAALVHAARVLKPGRTPEERAAAAILRAALFAPAMRIAENAGADGSAVAARISASDDPAYGYDARAGRFRNLIAAGVIDPARVAVAALESAVSVAALMLSTETVLAKPPPVPRPTSADDIPFGPEAKDMTADEAAGFGLV
ncbi:MAG: chaperonin GroEL, partial [Alphaproteobacteria bacterium]